MNHVMFFIGQTVGISVEPKPAVKMQKNLEDLEKIILPKHDEDGTGELQYDPHLIVQRIALIANMALDDFEAGFLSKGGEVRYGIEFDDKGKLLIKCSRERLGSVGYADFIYQNNYYQDPKYLECLQNLILRFLNWYPFEPKIKQEEEQKKIKKSINDEREHLYKHLHVGLEIVRKALKNPNDNASQNMAHIRAYVQTALLSGSSSIADIRIKISNITLKVDNQKKLNEEEQKEWDLYRKHVWKPELESKGIEHLKNRNIDKHRSFLRSTLKDYKSNV